MSQTYSVAILGATGAVGTADAEAETQGPLLGKIEEPDVSGPLACFGREPGAE